MKLSGKASAAIVIVSAVIICLLSFLISTQFLNPLTVANGAIRHDTDSILFGDGIDPDFIKGIYEDIQTGHVNGTYGETVRQNDPFPSENKEDYIFYDVRLKTRNNSVFKQAGIYLLIKDPDPDSDIILVVPPVKNQMIDRFESETLIMSTIVCKKDKTVDELMAEMLKLDVEIHYSNPTGEHVKTIHLKNLIK